jgi:peptidoglycan/LPS O-acetylase OafA/YrhL
MKDSSLAFSFKAIDGLRSLMNIWVVACHVTGLLVYFIFYAKEENDTQKREFLASKWPDFAIGFGYQVDVFFVISSFLLTWNFFTKYSKKEKTEDETDLSNEPKVTFASFNDTDFTATSSNLKTEETEVIAKSSSSQSSVVSKRLKGKNFVKETLLLLCKRLFRLWPGVIAAILISSILGDYLMDNVSVVLSLFGFPITRNVPMSFVVNWSSNVDCVCSVILFLVCYGLEYHQLWSLPMTVTLAVLSFVPKLVRFLTLMPRPSYLKIKQTGIGMFLPLYMDQPRLDYYQNILYPGRFNASDTVVRNTIKEYVMQKEYLVFHQRITPFFIGMILAYLIRKEYSSSRNKKEERRPRTNKVFHSIFLGFSILFAFQPLFVAIIGGSKGTLEELQTSKVQFTDPDPPLLPDLFLSCINRSLYATAFAYLLYRALLPSNHPLSLSGWKKFLELPVFSFLARYSYLIYCFHMKVMMEIMWNYFPPKFFTSSTSSTPLPIVLHFLFSFLLTYSISLFFAIIFHHFFEIPLQKYFFSPLLSKIEYILYAKNYGASSVAITDTTFVDKVDFLPAVSKGKEL